MKKNKMMRIASVLLVMTLLSTCVISGTFAKYVTKGSASDTARVAKWGIKIEAGTDGIFKTQYETDDPNYTKAADESGDDTGIPVIDPIGGGFEFTVVSSVDTEKVVAPGTKGELAKFSITGKPEVAIVCAFTDVQLTLGDGWVDAEGAFYCPLTIMGVSGLDYTSADAFAAAVKEAIEGGFHKTYPANTELTDKNNPVPQVTWEWPFETGETLADGGYANDVKDTYLGDQAAAGSAATVELAITVAITQID